MAFANIPEINSKEFAKTSKYLYDSKELTHAITYYQGLLKDIRSKIPKRFQLTYRDEDDERDSLQSM